MSLRAPALRAARTGDNECRVRVRSVVKWAGGKRGLLDRLVPLLPRAIDTYAEPFCGGAALFFHLAEERPRRYKRAVLADTNAELVALYRAIQTDPRALVERLRAYEEEHLALEEDGRRLQFYEIRELDPAAMSLAERGARLVFLNKTCFNGLWRVNASGRFNVPFGRYKKPRILNEARVMSAHAALADVELCLGDFELVTRGLRSGDFVYFDPPYVPMSKTSNFTAYAKEGFGERDQQRLAREFRRLAEGGVAAMLSNAYNEETRALYAGLHQKVIEAARPINSDSQKRGAVRELVVTNYARARRRLAS